MMNNDIPVVLDGLNDEIQSSNINRALALHFDLPISYIPQYAQALNSVLAGWFMSYFQAACPPYEEIVLNDNIVLDEICLSKSQWQKIRKDLLGQNILIQRKEGRKSYYSLNEDAIELALRGVSNHFAPVIDINRLHASTLIHNGLSLKVVILNAYFIQQHPFRALNERCDDGEPLAINLNEISQHTFLSVSEVKTALKHLQNHGIFSVINQLGQEFVIIHFAKIAELTAQFCDLNLGGD